MNYAWRPAIIMIAVILTMQCCCLNVPGLESIFGTATPPAAETPDMGITPPPEIQTTFTAIPTDYPTIAPTPAPPLEDAQAYDVVETVWMVNGGPGSVRIQFNMAMIQTMQPYQQVTLVDISPASYREETDQYGNRYAIFEIPDLVEGAEQVFTARYGVVVNPVRYELNSCVGNLPAEYTGAELYIESDSQQLIDLAARLGEGRSTACEKARAYYEYIGDTLTYAGYMPDEAGALSTINAGSGDCTDYADVMIALSRASGIPARFMEGVTCCTDNGYVEGQTKHDWTEVYLPSSGWVPVDPTYGQQPGNREGYFAALPADRIIVTRGQNLDTLSGYHYWSYTYWYDESQPVISANGEWSVLKAQ